MILTLANQLPPFICRILARRPGGWELKSLEEIAVSSGLSKSRVAQIATMKTWGTVTVATMDKFSKGCGVDLLHPSKYKRWLKASQLRAVMRASKSQRTAVLSTLIAVRG